MKCVSFHIVTMAYVTNEIIKLLNGLLDDASGNLNLSMREDWLAKRMEQADPYQSCESL